jgi:hypothetical protein
MARKTVVQISRQTRFWRCDWSEFCCLETANKTRVHCRRQPTHEMASEHYVRFRGQNKIGYGLCPSLTMSLV